MLILFASATLVACGGSSSSTVDLTEEIPEGSNSGPEEGESDQEDGSDDSEESGGSDDDEESGGSDDDEESGGSDDDEDSGGSDDDDSDGSGDEDGSGDNTIGQFDITEYLFDDALDFLGGTVSYPVTIFSIETGDPLFSGIDIGESFDKIGDNTILQTDLEGALLFTYEIQDQVVLETVHEANADRTFNRFVDVGDIYLNADNENTLLQATERATCEVIEHIDFFDMSTATGEFELATTVYEDVLHTYCETGFVAGGQFEAHTLLHHYFAKNTGNVLTTGTMLLFGDVYYLPDRTDP
jgi:hypothetical protein